MRTDGSGEDVTCTRGKYCLKARRNVSSYMASPLCYDETPSLRSSSLHIEAAGFAPPDAFGRFRVLHQIGAGTLGPVFRAYEPDRERLVAIKLFRRDLPPDRVHRLVGEPGRLRPP